MKRRAQLFLGMGLAVLGCGGCAAPSLIHFEGADGSRPEARRWYAADADQQAGAYRLAAGDALGEQIFTEYVAAVRDAESDQTEIVTGRGDDAPSP